MMITHHPTEINAILEVVKNVYNEKNHIGFEPHRYSRVLSLKKNLQNHIKSDVGILCPLYAAGEKKVQNIKSLILPN